MDFAKNLMEKYGWKEGQGLGKNETGISEPLKANFKFDSTGLGHNKADELNNHWWEHAYNEAANNLDIHKHNEHVVMQLKLGKSIEITKNDLTTSNVDGNDDVYSNGGFLKTSTLTNTGEMISHRTLPENPIESIKLPITDDELFAACQGRTAHKGARHGLNLSGKLNRIEQQENQLLEKFNQKWSLNDQSSEPRQIFTDWIEQNPWKKPKLPLHSVKNNVYDEEEDDDDDDEKHVTYTNQDDYISPMSKKQRKKNRKLDEQLATALQNSLTTDIKTSESIDQNDSLEKSSKLHGTVKSKTKKSKAEIRNSLKNILADELLGAPFVHSIIPLEVKKQLENKSISFKIIKNLVGLSRMVNPGFKFNKSKIDQELSNLQNDESDGEKFTANNEPSTIETKTRHRKKNRNKSLDVSKHQRKIEKRKRNKGKKINRKLHRRMNSTN